MSELSQINELYEAFCTAEEALGEANQEAENALRVYRRIATDLGDLLSGVGMTELRMKDGRQVKLEVNYFVSTAQERMDDIRQLLSEQGAEHMVKPKKIDISQVPLDELPETLQRKVQYEVNTNSLKAHVAELARQGALDERTKDLLKVHIENKVSVK